MYEKLYEDLLKEYPTERARTDKNGVLDCEHVMELLLTSPTKDFKRQKAESKIFFYNPPVNTPPKRSEEKRLIDLMNPDQAVNYSRKVGIGRRGRDPKKHSYATIFPNSAVYKRGLYFFVHQNLTLLYSPQEDIDKYSEKDGSLKAAKFTKRNPSYFDIYKTAYCGSKTDIPGKLNSWKYLESFNKDFLIEVPSENFEKHVSINGYNIGEYICKEDSPITKKGEQFFFDGESLYNQRACVSYSSRVMKSFEKA